MKTLIGHPEVPGILRSGRWFRALPSDLQTALLEIARVQSLSAGQRLFSRGDKPCGIYAVLSGLIRITGINHRGKEALLTFIEPPNWFGEITLFDKQLRTHDAVAASDCRILQLPQQALDQLLEREPAYWRYFGLLLTQKLRLAFHYMEDMALLPAPLRLTRRLVLMAEGYGDWDDRSRRVLHIHQESLGMMLAISRQTTNQILKDLEARGLIKVAYGEVEILDLDGLRLLGHIDHTEPE